MTAAGRRAILGLWLAFAASPAVADDTALARCGADKIAALARACGQLLASEARFRGDGDAAALGRRRGAPTSKPCA